MMRHPTVKLAGGGEEKEEKKATKGKRVGFQEADDDKPERDGEVSKHFFSLIIFPVLSCCHKGWTFLATA